MESKVKVYSNALFDDLIQDMDYTVNSSRLDAVVNRQTVARSYTSASQRMQARAATIGHGGQTRERKKLDPRKLSALRAERRKEMLIEQQRTKEAIHRRIKQKEEQFHELIRSLNQDNPFVDNVKHFLDSYDEDILRRKEKLYQEWMRDVYLPIQSQIESQLSTLSTSQIELNRRAMFEEFLSSTNDHSGLFLDIYEQSSYDPFKSRTLALTYSTAGIKDPTKRERLKTEEELVTGFELTHDPATMISSHLCKPQLSTTAASSKSRDMLDLMHWSKLDSTPFCRYEQPLADDDNGVYPYARNVSAPPPTNAKSALQSHIKFNHYSSESDPKLTKQEYFPRGKRVFPEKQAQSVF